MYVRGGQAKEHQLVMHHSPDWLHIGLWLQIIEQTHTHTHASMHACMRPHTVTLVHAKLRFLIQRNKRDRHKIITDGTLKMERLCACTCITIIIMYRLVKECPEDGER